MRENKSLSEFLSDLCEKDGSVQPVGPDYYNEFLINDGWLELVIRAILLSTTEDINKIAFSEDSQDEDIYEHFFKIMRFITEGIISIREDGAIVFTKPVGEPQTEEERIKIEARINSTRPMIEKMLRQCAD